MRQDLEKPGNKAASNPRRGAAYEALPAIAKTGDRKTFGS